MTVAERFARLPTHVHLSAAQAPRTASLRRHQRQRQTRRGPQPARPRQARCREPACWPWRVPSWPSSCSGAVMSSQREACQLTGARTCPALPPPPLPLPQPLRAGSEQRQQRQQQQPHQLLLWVACERVPMLQLRKSMRARQQRPQTHYKRMQGAAQHAPTWCALLWLVAGSACGHHSTRRAHHNWRNGRLRRWPRMRSRTPPCTCRI